MRHGLCAAQETRRTLGQLTLPSDFAVHRAQLDRIWGVEKDALDVSYVRVYEIDRTGR